MIDKIQNDLSNHKDENAALMTKVKEANELAGAAQLKAKLNVSLKQKINLKMKE